MTGDPELMSGFEGVALDDPEESPFSGVSLGEEEGLFDGVSLDEEPVLDLQKITTKTNLNLKGDPVLNQRSTRLSDKELFQKILRNEIAQNTILGSGEVIGRAFERADISGRIKLLSEAVNNPNTFLDDYGRITYAFSQERDLVSRVGYAYGALEILASDEKADPEKRNKAKELMATISDVIKSKEEEFDRAEAEQKEREQKYFEERSPLDAGIVGVLEGL